MCCKSQLASQIQAVWLQDADTARWNPRGALAGALEVYSKPSKPPLTTTTKFQVLARPPISRHKDALNQTRKFDGLYVDGILLYEHDDSLYQVHYGCLSIGISIIFHL